MDTCLHCTTPLKSTQESFCCRGCESVYEIIHSSGHEMFYDLKADTPLTPLRERPFQERDWSWLTEMAQSDDTNAPSIILGINGLTCVACVWLVEAVAKKVPGIYDVHLSITRGSVEITYNPRDADFEKLANELYRLGYELSPKVNSARTSSSLAIQLGICGALAMNTMAFTLPRYTGMEASEELYQLLTIIVIASSSLTFFIGGSYFFKRAWSSLKMGHIHMDLPISIGLILAYVGSFIGWATSHEGLFYFDFVAIFTFLMLLGKQVQNTSLNKANSKFGVENTIPEKYQVENSEKVATSDIKQGHRIIIPAGTVVPSPSRLLSEMAECSLAWITGEPETIVYSKSDPLPAGAVNQSQNSITVEAVEDVDNEHFFHQIPQQQQALSPALSTFIRIYLISILVIGFGAGLVWLIATDDWKKAAQVTISVYVVSCPCGLGLALPLLDTRFNNFANNIGVFPLTPTCWPGFQKLKQVVFDKTGTLTLDRPELSNPEQLDALSDEEKQYLFHLTKKSLHPLSRSIFSALIHQGITHSKLDLSVTETPGLGVSTEHEGTSYSLTRPEHRTNKLSCVFTRNDCQLAHLEFVESPREHTQEALFAINRALPEKSMILSGDVEQSVKQLANKLGIVEYFAELKPDQKLAKIKELQLQHDLLYIGDGINDIPAMREARLSAAPFANMNLVTNDVDMLFTDETLGFLPRLLQLAKIRDALSKNLLIYTLLYNLIVVAVAAAGYMSPLVAAIIMPTSSLVSLYIVTRKFKHV